MQKTQDLINIEKVLVEDVLPWYNNELNIQASPFLEKIKNIIDFEPVIMAHKNDLPTLYKAKRMGFSDTRISTYASLEVSTKFS